MPTCPNRERRSLKLSGRASAATNPQLPSNALEHAPPDRVTSTCSTPCGLHAAEGYDWPHIRAAGHVAPATFSPHSLHTSHTLCSPAHQEDPSSWGEGRLQNQHPRQEGPRNRAGLGDRHNRRHHRNRRGDRRRNRPKVTSGQGQRRCRTRPRPRGTAARNRRRRRPRGRGGRNRRPAPCPRPPERAAAGAGSRAVPLGIPALRNQGAGRRRAGRRRRRVGAPAVGRLGSLGDQTRLQEVWNGVGWL